MEEVVRLEPLTRAATFLSFTLASGVLIYGEAPSQGQPIAQQYLQPPEEIRRIVGAERVPDTRISVTGELILLLDKASAPSIADVAAPFDRVAGYRIDTRTGARRNLNPYMRVRTKNLKNQVERELQLPPGSYTADISPDGRHIAVTVTNGTGTQLSLADASSGAVRSLVPSGISAVNDFLCVWRRDSSGLLCWMTIPANRRPIPPEVPPGPRILETSGQRAAPTRAYQDVLISDYDEQLFDYYFENQLAWISLDGDVRPIGRPGVFATAEISPDGQWLTVARLTKPYSRAVRAGQFARSLELWRADGSLVRTLATTPATDAQLVRRGEAPAGARMFRWHALEPATLLYAEAQPGGTTDHLKSISAPFDDAATVIASFTWPIDGVQITEKHLVLVSELERSKRLQRWSAFDPAKSNTRRELWTRGADDRSDSGGWALGRAGGAIAQDGDDIFLSGDGPTPAGSRPFLDRFNLKTSKRTRLWQADATALEYVFALLNQTGTRLLTQRQSASMPPNLFVRDLRNQKLTPLTRIPDPHPQLSAMKRQLLTYLRKDGVPLSGTLFWPADHKPGTTLPLLIWTYPREFANAQDAAQILQSENRFRPITSASPLLLVSQGYAVLLEPTMPVIGADGAANNAFHEHVISSAEAAIDKVVEMGIADRDRAAIGGHSYGGFTVAYLLAHTKLFRAGIARSGPYNRTLTPFGFQNEHRTLWQAPELYSRMSPLMVADRIKRPLLLMHGELDETVPILQSELFYHALKGTGATARLVVLPYEGHTFSARESISHIAAEMLAWLDKYVTSSASK